MIGQEIEGELTDEQFRERYSTLIKVLGDGFEELIVQRGSTVGDYLNVVVAGVSPVIDQIFRQVRLWAAGVDVTLQEERTKSQQYLTRLDEQKLRVLKADLAIEEIRNALMLAGLPYKEPQKSIEALTDELDSARMQAQISKRLLDDIWAVVSVDGIEAEIQKGTFVDAQPSAYHFYTTLAKRIREMYPGGTE